MAELGTLSRERGFTVAVLTRRLDHAPDVVWRMLTEATGQWLAPGRVEPRLGGAVRLEFADSGAVIESAVTAFERLMGLVLVAISVQMILTGIRTFVHSL